VDVQELNTSLIQAWQEDQRVKSLKIVIQCAKLLSDISVIQFYPSKFVLVTDILDTFGRLVYDRIIDKATLTTTAKTGSARHSTEMLTPDQVVIIIFLPASTKPQAEILELNKVNGWHSVIIVFWKETAFPR